MKKLTYIILHLLILPLLLYGFSFSVSAEETSSEDTVIQVTAEDGSDISQKLNEALINAQRSCRKLRADCYSQGSKR